MLTFRVMCWNHTFTSDSSGLKDMESCPCIADSEQYLLPASEGQRSVSPNTGLCHSLDRGEPADLRIKAAQALDEFADKDVDIS